jgi:hypothetical protein
MLSMGEHTLLWFILKAGKFFVTQKNEPLASNYLMAPQYSRTPEKKSQGRERSSFLFQVYSVKHYAWQFTEGVSFSYTITHSEISHYSHFADEKTETQGN